MKRLRRTLVYHAARGFTALFERLPRPAALTLGGMLGLALYKIQRRDAWRAERNLRLAYPGTYNLKQSRALAQGAFINTGFHICDTIRSRSRYHSELADLLDVTGLEHFERIYRRGHGVVAATGHIGAFELLAAFFGRSGYKTAVVGRAAYERRLDQLLVETRARNNVVTIPTTEPLAFARALKAGFAVGVLIDNDSHRVRSEYLESCGRLARTPIGQTVIGLRVAAGFMPLVCRRHAGRYHLRFFPEFYPRDFGPGRTGSRLRAAELTWRMRRILDEQIAEHPTQWPWVHNRWRSAPGDDEYPLPGLRLWRQGACQRGKITA
ncbi:MAG TPA: hypothetical protein VLB27_03510 [candidate division Zixibacteria bacterium]|nr:hypothetical protein [candidate division Zixibacteria bacterium]